MISFLHLRNVYINDSVPTVGYEAMSVECGS